MARRDVSGEVSNPRLRRRTAGRYAESGQLDKRDEPLLESATGRDAKRHPEDVLPDTPAAEGAPGRDVSGQPVSEETAPVPGHDRDDDLDGLNEMEASIRRAAEEPLAPGDEEEEAQEEDENRRE
ncbi:MAG TPA: hypothetical protein VK035_02625 [Kiloniellales bacterium]|nr:hypothetical protein [Kiloniellales bacterium]